MHVLNLDELRTHKEFSLNGKTRRIRSLTVGEFIESGNVEAKVKDKTTREQISILIDFILKFVEDTTRDELHLLELHQLMALIGFMRGADIAGEQGEQAQENPEAQEGNASPKS